MRILYLTRFDSVHDQRFMQTLAESGHQAYVWRLYSGDAPLPEGVTEIKWSEIENGLQAWNLNFALKELQKAIDFCQPDLIHAGPLQDLTFLAGKTNFPNILAMSWGFDLMHDVKVDKLVEHRARFALQRSNALITDAECSADVAVSLGFEREKIFVFPWGVDLAHFDPQKAKTAGKALREELGWQNKTVLLCLRSWEPNYAVDVLLSAFEKAIEINPELRLLLLNDGSLQDEFMKTLQKESLENKVYLGGRVPNDDLIKYYGAADIYVTPSHVDGSSVSLMEALACGLPVIASDIPANLEWVKPDYNGWIFPDGAVDALSDIILTCQVKQSLAENARKTAETKANWQKNKQVLLAAYQQLVPKEE